MYIREKMKEVPMADEIFSGFENVTIENIASLTAEHSRISERRLCEIADLASSAAEYYKKMHSDGVEIYEFLSLISEFYPEVAFSADNALDINYDRLKASFLQLDSLGRASFAEILLEFLNKEGLLVSESDFLPSVEADETFVYVKNPYADEAYDVFSQDFSDPRVRYAENFRQAVKLVSDKAVTYALLPLEERGARLASVAELIYRSELKINSVIPVFGIDGNADMKYALISRHFSVPRITRDDDRYLEIRMPQNSSPGLSELLSVAESYGIRAYRVNTLTFDSADGKESCFSIVFSGEGVDFTVLLIFLTLFAAEYTAVGIYKNLEG